MSGSGSTIYCVGEPACGAEAFREAVTDKFDIQGIWRAELVRRVSERDWYTAPPRPER